jgi:hypothetical protein
LLVINIFIFCALDGSKCASEGNSESYYKCTAIDLERGEKDWYLNIKVVKVCLQLHMNLVLGYQL